MINENYLNKRKLLSLFSIFLISIIAISTINMVTAADITIDSNSTGGIKEALKVAKDGDTINLKNGKYSGVNNTKIKITKSITIKGVGSNVVLDGEGKNRFFNISGDKVSLKKVKFTNGYSTFRAGIFHIKGSLTLNNCSFTKFNGGVIDSDKGNLTLTNCIFENNKGNEAICSYSKITVNRCIFNNNKAEYGGGAIYAGGSSLIVKNSIFTNNKANYNGGGAIYTFAKFTVTNSTFTNNKATNNDGGYSNGGAICIFAKSTVSKCTFKNNLASYNGGAIYASANSIITGSTFTKNKAKKGGAICGEKYGQSGYLPLTLKITNSKFSKNIAGKKYNAIYNQAKCKLTKNNVKISPK